LGKDEKMRFVHPITIDYEYVPYETIE